MFAAFYPHIWGEARIFLITHARVRPITSLARRRQKGRMKGHVGPA